MTSQTPPGWYRDPYGTPGLQRYWDGNQWTQVTQPADEWGTQGGAAQETPAGYTPGGTDGQPASEYGQQQAPGYGYPQAAEYGQQQAPGYGYQQTPEHGQQQSGWPPPGGGSDWSTGGQQPWQQQPPANGKSNAGLMWALIGGGAVVVVLVVVVALFATGVIGGGSGTASGSSSGGTTATSPEASSAPGSGGGSGKAPVTGTVSDTRAGLSYAQLGPPWQPPQAIRPTSNLGKLGFSRGAIATVQTDYDGPNSSYVASVYSGVLPSTVRSGSLEQAAKNLFTAAYPEAYPTPNTKQDVESKSYTVSGKKAWIYKAQMSFPQAETKGWNFSKETAVVVTVELASGKPPATFYISVPDSHKTQGDIDLLLGSLKAQ
jgi:hypothetical protein